MAIILKNIFQKEIQKIENGIYFLTNVNDVFELTYLNVRKKEGWLYPKEMIINLPDIAPSNTHYKLWQVRNKSANQLINYLKRINKDLCVLDVGCVFA